jgi:uncharacterized protein (DUF924 family)
VATDAARIDAIIDFWFGELADGVCTAERRKRFFAGGEAFDAEIRSAFGDDVEAALAGDLDHWAATARGRLALVVALDQFPRNLFRGTARAWAGDDAALGFAREGVGRGDDAMLEIEPRIFLWLPFEHSESPTDQRTMAVLLRRLAQALPDDAPAAGVVAAYRRHADEHRAIVERFQRFPHRNAALGRPSTDAEAEWLAGGGKRFGQ